MEDSIGKISVCIHGGMRHKCETCDLAARLEAAEASLADCSKEYHAAINEPEYAGTRQDWIWRAQAAEATLAEYKLVTEVAEQAEMRYHKDCVVAEARVRELEQELAAAHITSDYNVRAFDQCNERWEAALNERDKQLGLNADLVMLVRKLQRQIAVLEHKDGERQERSTEEGTLP